MLFILQWKIPDKVNKNYTKIPIFLLQENLKCFNKCLKLSKIINKMLVEERPLTQYFCDSDANLECSNCEDIQLWDGLHPFPISRRCCHFSRHSKTFVYFPRHSRTIQDFPRHSRTIRDLPRPSSQQAKNMLCPIQNLVERAFPSFHNSRSLNMTPSTITSSTMVHLIFMKFHYSAAHPIGEHSK